MWPTANECGNIFEVLRSVCNAKTVILKDQATKVTIHYPLNTVTIHYPLNTFSFAKTIYLNY